VDPIIEGGRHRKRARAWDVDEPIAVALLGEVTIDLPQIKSAPGEIDIGAYAIFRAMPACPSPRAPTSRCPAASFEVTWATPYPPYPMSTAGT
jgi:hypothetical protein